MFSNLQYARTISLQRLLYDLFRAEMGHYLACFAGVPLGDVLVKDVQAVNISGNDCLTASLWITGENGACNYRSDTATVLSDNYT